jgi:hypothetical protein
MNAPMAASSARTVSKRGRSGTTASSVALAEKRRRSFGQIAVHRSATMRARAHGRPEIEGSDALAPNGLD